ERERLFCQKYIVCGSPTKAAIETGYSPKQASHTGPKLLRRPVVQAYLAELRKQTTAKLSDDAKYGVERAMAELGEAIEFAKQTENATAYVRALELRARLHGLIIDKAEIKNQSPFSIVIAGLPGPQPLPAIDVTPQAPALPAVEIADAEL